MDLILRNTNLIFQKGKYDEYESTEFVTVAGESIVLAISFGKYYSPGTQFKIKIVTSNNTKPVDDANGLNVQNNLGGSSISPNNIKIFNEWVDNYTNSSTIEGIQINRGSHVVGGVTMKMYIRAFPQE